MMSFRTVLILALVVLIADGRERKAKLVKRHSIQPRFRGISNTQSATIPQSVVVGSFGKSPQPAQFSAVPNAAISGQQPAVVPVVVPQSQYTALPHQQQLQKQFQQHIQQQFKQPQQAQSQYQQPQHQQPQLQQPQLQQPQLQQPQLQQPQLHQPQLQQPQLQQPQYQQPQYKQPPYQQQQYQQQPQPIRPHTQFHQPQKVQAAPHPPSSFSSGFQQASAPVRTSFSGPANPIVRQALTHPPAFSQLIAARDGRGRSLVDKLPSNATLIRPNIVDGFSCLGRKYGYYADQLNDCQIFHVCYPLKSVFLNDPSVEDVTYQFSFICNEFTAFSQDSMTCAWKYEAVPCEYADRLYSRNDEFFKTTTPAGIGSYVQAG